MVCVDHVMLRAVATVTPNGKCRAKINAGLLSYANVFPPVGTLRHWECHDVSLGMLLLSRTVIPVSLHHIRALEDYSTDCAASLMTRLLLPLTRLTPPKKAKGNNSQRHQVADILPFHIKAGSEVMMLCLLSREVGPGSTAGLVSVSVLGVIVESIAWAVGVAYSG
jgi:hypothetical protein